jgi:hypothetical protein
MKASPIVGAVVLEFHRTAANADQYCIALKAVSGGKPVVPDRAPVEVLTPFVQVFRSRNVYHLGQRRFQFDAVADRRLAGLLAFGATEAPAR